MLSASSRGHGHEHSGVPTKLEQFFFSKRWLQTHDLKQIVRSSSRRAAIWSFESCISWCWDLVSWRELGNSRCFNCALKATKIWWIWKTKLNEKQDHPWMQPTTTHYKIIISNIFKLRSPNDALSMYHSRWPPWLLHGRRLCPSVQPKMALHLLPSTIFLVKTPRIRSDCNIRSLSRSKRTEADSVWRACSWDQQKGNSLLSEAPKITKNCQESLS